MAPSGLDCDWVAVDEGTITAPAMIWLSRLPIEAPSTASHFMW